ncbi:MAG: RidA family protein [Deltaproteobacteria bacterium]|nr:RidA family protein [Nannocystaceae bacterium]
MTQTITRMNPPSLPDAGAAGYSQISIAEPGRLAFMSGQVAWRSDGKPTPTTLLGQTEVVIGNLEAALAAVGATPHHLVMLKIYVVDLTPERMAEAMPLVMTFLGGAQPSLTGVGVAALAGPGLQLEIEMVVRLP